MFTGLIQRTGTIAAVENGGGTMRIHAMRLLSLGPEENPGHQGCDACRWLSRCLGDERRYRHIPFSRQLLVGRAVRRYLYQERGASERSSWLVGVPIWSA